MQINLEVSPAVDGLGNCNLQMDDRGVDLMSQSNLVRIGRKPLMNYVTACVTLFNRGVREVVVRARGQAITTAVDTVLLLQRAFVKDLNIKNISIGSENLRRDDGTEGRVSTIEILLTKGS
jgi:DNA-binding protein